MDCVATYFSQGTIEFRVSNNGIHRYIHTQNYIIIYKIYVMRELFVEGHGLSGRLKFVCDRPRHGGSQA